MLRQASCFGTTAPECPCQQRRRKKKELPSATNQVGSFCSRRGSKRQSWWLALPSLSPPVATRKPCCSRSALGPELEACCNFGFPPPPPGLCPNGEGITAHGVAPQGHILKGANKVRASNGGGQSAKPLQYLHNTLNPIRCRLRTLRSGQVESRES